MDHTIALIQKSHEGDDEARAQDCGGKYGTGLVYRKTLRRARNRNGRPVPDRNDRTAESN